MKPSPADANATRGKTRAQKTAKSPGTARGPHPISPASSLAKKDLTPLQALEMLQAHLRLTPLQASRWITVASDARR